MKVSFLTEILNIEGKVLRENRLDSHERPILKEVLLDKPDLATAQRENYGDAFLNGDGKVAIMEAEWIPITLKKVCVGALQTIWPNESVAGDELFKRYAMALRIIEACDNTEKMGVLELDNTERTMISKATDNWGKEYPGRQPVFMFFARARELLLADGPNGSAAAATSGKPKPTVLVEDSPPIQADEGRARK